MASLATVLSQIRQRESGGNYTLTPQQNFDYPRSHASGAYQFQPGTWRDWTGRSGIGTQYTEAYLAPASVQDAVAGYAATHGNVNSTALWGYSAPSGGYPTVDVGSTSLTLGSDPGSAGVTGLTISSDLNPGLGSEGLRLNADGTYTSTATPGAAGDPSNPLGIGTDKPAGSTGAGFPGTGAGGSAITVNLADLGKGAVNLAGAIGGGFSSVIGAAESWISTGLIGLLALILIGVGLFWLAIGSPATIARKVIAARAGAG